MRILMLSQFYPPIIGGEELLVQGLGVELVRRGHQVAVATVWHTGMAEFEQDDGIRVYRIRSTVMRVGRLFSEPQRRHVPPWPDPEAMMAIRRIVAWEQPEIVHAHNWLLHSFLPLKTWSKARLILTLHDYSLVCAKKRLMYRGALCGGPGVKKCLTCAVNHYGAAKGVPTAVSNWVMGDIERSAVDMFLPISQAVAVGNGLVGSQLPYHVIPNFLVANEARALPTDIDSYLAQLPDDGYLLFAGDLSDDKGIGVLLRAYAGLTNAPPLVLIGRYHTQIKQSIPGVIVLNSWSHDAVMEAWRRSSIALVPSVWAEPFGLVAIEAMSTGRPVIASRIGGLPDIVLDGETGLLVPPGDPLALRHAIERLLKDSELRERLGQAGRRRVKEFQACNILPRIEQVYRQLVQQ